MTHTLIQHPDALAVVRLGPGSDVPSWATASTLFSVTATKTETSIVCHASTVPTKARREGPFVAFEVAGPLDFAETGVLSGLLAGVFPSWRAASLPIATTLRQEAVA